MSAVYGCTGGPAETAAQERQSLEAFSAPAKVTFLEEDSRAYSARLDELFERDAYTEWEAEGHAALRSTGRFPDGLTMGEVYFEELDNGQYKWNSTNPFQFREAVQKWQKQFPESHAARIALIYVYIDNAWKKRGGGFSNTVTEAGWKNFRSYLGKARDEYDACLRDGINYPALYIVGLKLAVGQSWSREETEQTLLAGLHQDPLSQDLYKAMSWYLMPKWYGSNGAARDFFYQACDLARPEAGAAMGFVVAWYFTDQLGEFNEGFEFNMPWQDLRAAYGDFAKVFPNATEAHNRFALFAVDYDQKDAAAEVFESAAATHHGGVWSRPTYDAWKAWAVDDAPAPRYTDLHRAAADGNLERVQKAIAESEGVDMVDGYGLTPLYYAVVNDRLDTAEALLEAGANPDAVINGQEHTLLYSAVDSSQEAMANLLVDHGAYFTIEVSPGRPLFNRLFHKGLAGVAENIVRAHGGDVNLQDETGYAALHVAAGNGNVDDVRRLLALGADVNIQGGLGDTPLLTAINADHEECATYLVQAGADITLTLKDGTTTLIAAVDQGFKPLVRTLLDRGADVVQKDLDGWSALHMATMNGNQSMLTMLLDVPGANVNIATNEGRTLVHQAAKSGHVDLLRVLVERGAALNTRNNAGKTALDLALDEEMLAAAKYLQSVGAERGM